MSGLINFARLVASGDTSFRDTAMTDKIGEQTVDTVFAPDMCEWETGIERDKWTIVETYPDKESAEKGHNEWVNKIKKNPKLEIEGCRDVEEWAFG